MTNTLLKISCIIPVYNESRRILGVLKAIVGHPLIDEVIVVNDGSTDNTEALLQKASGIKFISYQKNRGKSHAVMTGFKAAQNDTVMMLDSDGEGLLPEHITSLIEPVANGSADISLSLRQNSLLIYKLFGLDYVTGERVFNKNIMFKDLDELDTIPGFILESYMNNIIIRQKMRIRVVKLHGFIQCTKQKKMGFIAGTIGDYKMITQIIRYMGLWGIFRQFTGMLALKV